MKINKLTIGLMLVLMSILFFFFHLLMFNNKYHHGLIDYVPFGIYLILFLYGAHLIDRYENKRRK